MAHVHQYQAGNADRRWMIVHAYSAVWAVRADRQTGDGIQMCSACYSRVPKLWTVYLWYKICDRSGFIVIILDYFLIGQKQLCSKKQSIFTLLQLFRLSHRLMKKIHYFKTWSLKLLNQYHQNNSPYWVFISNSERNKPSSCGTFVWCFSLNRCVL